MSVEMAFTASEAEAAQQALATLVERYGNSKETQADIIIALGGDGFMLQTLQRTQALAIPVYGMNRGTIGFLMNEFCVDDLPQRVLDAEKTVINPLAGTHVFVIMRVLCVLTAGVAFWIFA